MKAWHTLALAELVRALDTDLEQGLAQRIAGARMASTGANTISATKAPSVVDLFVRQFKDFMVLTLVAATVVASLVGETTDALAIIAILFLNAVLGSVQEYRAERALMSLRALSAPTARVVRDGLAQRLGADTLVPGDVILLEAGDRVPADARVVEVQAMEADESALTGEAFAVSKAPLDGLERDLALGDRANMVYAGTAITRGRGRAVVVATGMDTQMGHIAHMLQEAGAGKTPLQRRLAHLGGHLVVLCAAVCLAVGILGMLRGEAPARMLLTGVSLAVAAIPEGLPAVVTVALALGVQRMARGNAIVRRLPAVETLGCATVVCSDKTGTLTQNRMVLAETYTLGPRTWVPAGGPREPSVERLLLLGALCNNASISRGFAGVFARGAEGDPTEVALLDAAWDARVYARARRYRRVSEVPFDAERRLMSVLVRSGGEIMVVLKGAPEAVVPLCSDFGPAGSREEALEAAAAMASRGLRVLALAERRLEPGDPLVIVEDSLILTGLVGIADPPRPEAVRAVRELARAGIRTVMVTGDHPNTAVAIASQMGILAPGGRSLSGMEMDSMPDALLERVSANVMVYARVSPGHKMRIIRALKAQGHVVAMTGDGVNDAPAVKAADIGIAMGRCGTDVTRDAADMVLADDNFATIAVAVREGRAIYDNIRKFVRYLLACNIGEVLTMFIAAILGLPLPLIPVQILWVNLATDGLPAIALGLEPPEEGVMSRPPRPANEGFLGRGLSIKIVVRGILIGVTTLGAFAWRLQAGVSLEEARTWAFAVLVACQLWHVFDCRSEKGGPISVPLSRNPFLAVSVALSWVMLSLAVYHPFLQGLFCTVPLSWGDWAIVVAVSSAGSILTALWARACQGEGIPAKPANGTGYATPGGCRRWSS
ncbi:MAG: cation-translocating P-type ATPase [Bacillota bacterium]